jgi:hypothetical protein
VVSKAFKVVWQALKDTWGDLFMLSVLNLIWFLCILGPPLIPMIPVTSIALLPRLVALGVLFALILPVMTAAFYPVSHRVATGKTFHLSDYWDGVKTYWWRAILWFLANAMAVVLWWTNLNFYAGQIPRIWKLQQIPAVWPVVLINGFWTSVFFVWLLTQMYFWPMMMVQKDPNIAQAWRNGLVLVLRFPVFSLLIGIIGLILLALSIVLMAPLFLFAMGLLAILYSNATLTLLVEAGIIEGDYRPDYTR